MIQAQQESHNERYFHDGDNKLNVADSHSSYRSDMPYGDIRLN